MRSNINFSEPVFSKQVHHTIVLVLLTFNIYPLISSEGEHEKRIKFQKHNGKL